MKNPELEKQVSSMINLLHSFNHVCKIAALKNDGIIDPDEQKTINAIDKATKKYIQTLNEL